MSGCRQNCAHAGCWLSHSACLATSLLYVFAVRHAHSDAVASAETEYHGQCHGLGLHGNHVIGVATTSHLLVDALNQHNTARKALLLILQMLLHLLEICTSMITAGVYNTSMLFSWTLAVPRASPALFRRMSTYMQPQP